MFQRLLVWFSTRVCLIAASGNLVISREFMTMLKFSHYNEIEVLNELNFIAIKVMYTECRNFNSYAE